MLLPQLWFDTQPWAPPPPPSTNQEPEDMFVNTMFTTHINHSHHSVGGLRPFNFIAVILRRLIDGFSSLRENYRYQRRYAG
jgi:hypothetical protein